MNFKKNKILALLLLLVSFINAQIITDVNPKVIKAGMDTITIKGTGFGNTPGSVVFPIDPGVSGAVTHTTALSALKWTDTEIKIVYPSEAIADQNILNGYNEGKLTPIGISLKPNDAAGAVFMSKNIALNIIGAVDSNLVHANAKNGGHEVFIHRDLYNNLAARETIQRVIEYVRCATGFNITIGGVTDVYGKKDETFNSNGLPMFNIIMLDDMNKTLLGSGVHGACTNYTLSTSPATRTGFDMVMQNNTLAPGYTWNYGPNPPGPTELDFESVFLHELSHAIGLIHTLNDDDLMSRDSKPGKMYKTYEPHHLQLIKSVMDRNKTVSGKMTPYVCTNSVCQDYVTVITNVLTGVNSIQQAGISVTATNTINTGAIADYHAGTEVVMKDGFTALTGSDFKGYIATCVGTTGTTTAKMETPLANETSTTDFVKVYPSPTTGNFTVDVDAKVNKYLLNIFNIEGRMVYRNDTSNHKHNIDITNQPTGLYIIVIVSEDGKKYSKKIIKK